jgi:hypothetical protein
VILTIERLHEETFKQSTAMVNITINRRSNESSLEIIGHKKKCPKQKGVTNVFDAT